MSKILLPGRLHGLFYSAASLGLGVLLAAFAGSASAQTIKVGEYASLTGADASFGQMSHHGTEMAINEINAKGGVLGKKLELITEDDLSKAGEAKTCARKLISRDEVVALLGEAASGRSLEAAPICQQSKIPMISPSSVDPRVTQTGDYIFRVCFTGPFQAEVISKFVLNTLKLKNVAIMKDTGLAYSVGLDEAFHRIFPAAGGKIVREEDYSHGATDFRAQLTAVKAANPDGIFVPGYYDEAALICRQAKELGINVPIFGGDGWDSMKLIEIGGDAVNGNYFATHFSPDQKTPLAQDFVKKFKEKYGADPDSTAATGYDSALLLADAIKRAGTTDGPKLRDAIADTKNFQGVTGNITIDKERNARKLAVFVKVSGGKFEFVETVNP